MKRLFKFGLLVAAVGFIGKVVATQKREWSDLSEAEVRLKLDQKLGSKVPEKELQDIGDKVVDAMRSKGKLREESEGGDAAAEEE